MKFYTKSLPIALIALMLNCSKSSPSPSIIGTWTRKTTTYSGCTYSGNNGTVVYSCPATATSDCDKLILNSNGKFTRVVSWIDAATGKTVDDVTMGPYSISGSKLTITDSGYDFTYTFVVSADNKTLTLTSNDSNGCTVTKIHTK